MNYQKTVFIEYPNGGNLFDDITEKSGLLQVLQIPQILEFKNLWQN